MTTSDPWLVTATHECGHLISYIHFGWKFGGVKIWQDDDGEIRGSVVSPAGDYDPFARAITCVCGPVAEQVLTGVPIEQQPGSRTDIIMTLYALARADFAEPLDLESIMPFTRLLIENRWADLVRIADRLMIEKQLDHAQVVRLIETV
jgi:hypothetical protein